jgi:hypothetical protein
MLDPVSLYGQISDRIITRVPGMREFMAQGAVAVEPASAEAVGEAADKSAAAAGQYGSFEELLQSYLDAAKTGENTADADYLRRLLELSSGSASSLLSYGDDTDASDFAALTQSYMEQNLLRLYAEAGK